MEAMKGGGVNLSAWEEEAGPFGVVVEGRESEFREEIVRD